MNKKVNRNFQKVIYFYENFYKADLNKKLMNLVFNIKTNTTQFICSPCLTYFE